MSIYYFTCLSNKTIKNQMAFIKYLISIVSDVFHFCGMSSKKVRLKIYLKISL